jgi:uncharacterized membrane protein YoaK (UPF0700 family)
VSLGDRLTDRWSSYQLSWMSLILPLPAFALGGIGFYLLPMGLLWLAFIVPLAAVVSSFYLTLLSACSNCGRPNGTRYDPWPARRCKRCGDDLTRPFDDG